MKVFILDIRSIEIIGNNTCILKLYHINLKTIFTHLLTTKKPKIEQMQDSNLFKWDSIWKNMAFKSIKIKERETLYKHMDEILPTRK